MSYLLLLEKSEVSIFASVNCSLMKIGRNISFKLVEAGGIPQSPAYDISQVRRAINNLLVYKFWAVSCEL